RFVPVNHFGHHGTSNLPDEAGRGETADSADGQIGPARTLSAAFSQSNAVRHSDFARLLNF
ncbi:MAG TPA: hypothetical protein VHV51_07180, partial [Polyangiaceae bacterium]|nr:hypothetical protein [Polyangiaceae bacterium]